MNFYINEIRLWFRKDNSSKSYKFYPDKVNVITGDSSTGKSSILRIIDYCLLAPESTIVEDVINDSVAWYGLSFHLNGEDLLIARRAPESEIVNYDIYWGEGLDFPEYPTPSEGVMRGYLAEILNKKFNVEEFTFEVMKNKVQLSFRHLLLFNYLTEDIIAVFNSYLDTKFFADKTYDSILSDLIKIVIGMDEGNEQDLLKKKTKLDNQLKNELKHRDDDALHKKKYQDKLFELKTKVVQLELANDSLFNIEDEDLIFLIREGIDKYKSFLDNKRKQKEIKELEYESRLLREKIASYRILKKEYDQSIAYSKSVKDSLQPVKYLQKHIDEVVLSHETLALYKSLESAFDSISSINNNIENLPADFYTRYDELLLKLDENKNKLKIIKDLGEKVYDPGWVRRVVSLEYEFSQTIKSKPKFKFKGEANLIDLKDNLARTNKRFEEVKKDNAVCLRNLDEFIGLYYTMQRGISDNYSSCIPSFDIDNAVLKLFRDKEHLDKSIRNIGSKSNYMFMHLCFFLGLHELLLVNGKNSVGSFLFIDQPSIPYYGKNKSTVQNVIRGKGDSEKLKEAFRLINGFMERNIKFTNRSHFQIILIEHADPSYWKNEFEFFETRYQFVEEVDYGLIPKEFIHRL